MKFKIDKNLPIEAAQFLREQGHQADTVSEQGRSGCPDAEIAEICLSENRVLITLDSDFADIRAYPPDQYPGIIVLRLNRTG